MKKIIFIGLTSVLCFISNAQQLSNGSLSGTCTGNGFTAPSCIKGWSSSHGNPTVLGNLNTNTWAWLSISKENSDGIFTDYNFIIGKTYKISFKIKTLSTVENSFSPMANVIATTGLKGYSSRIPISSENNETIWSKGLNKKTNRNWQTVSITYTPTKSNTQLWFYPSVEYISKLNEKSKVQMEIDDIEVNNVNDNLVSNTIDSINQTATSATEYIVPNPAHRGQLTKLLINPNVVNKVALINLNGEMKKLNFIPLDTKTISFILDFTTSRGFHTLEIIKKDGSILTKKLIVE